MTEGENARRPRWTRLAVMVVAVAFLAGPTPGDVGGCGGDQAGTLLRGNLQEQEYDYFDRGLCAHMCMRLRSCGVLCRAISDAPASCDACEGVRVGREGAAVPEGTNCGRVDELAYIQCVRGELRAQIFAGRSGTVRCPHACSDYRGTFLGASELEVDTCGHAVSELNCTDGISNVINQPPTECTGLCQ